MYYTKSLNDYSKWNKYDIFIDWDMPNWNRALQFLDDHKHTEFHGKKVLEIGAGSGGLSFWAALNGAEVICSDINEPSEVVINKVKKYKIKNIKFEKFDALEIPYREEFDFVVFKSILGGISRSNNLSDLVKIMYGIHNVLKPAGQCLFIENMDGTYLHQYLRKRYGAGKNMWYYLSLEDFSVLSKPFKIIKYHTFGFLGGGDFLFKNYRSKLDYYFEKIIPQTWNYIYAGIYQK